MIHHHYNEHLQDELNNIIYICRIHDKDVKIKTNNQSIKYITRKNKRKVKMGIIWVFNPVPALNEYVQDFSYHNKRITQNNLFEYSIIDNNHIFKNNNICLYCKSEYNTTNTYLCHLNARSIRSTGDLDVFCPHSNFMFDELNYFFNNV
jgi:hypothetical protein